MKSKPDKFTAQVALNIKLERIKRALSQEKLAELAGLSRGAYGAIERGTSSPTVETLAAIAQALDTDICNFFKFD